MSKQSKGVVLCFAIICVGIWCTAVYSGHHYIIDVLLGIATTLIGIFLLEGVAYRIPIVRKGLDGYERAITLHV